MQPLIDATYSAFFKIAPALAGAQQDGGQTGGGRNEQRIDLTGGIVENCVRVPLSLPWARAPSAIEIRMDGVVAPSARDGDALDVQFTECAVRLTGDSPTAGADSGAALDGALPASSGGETGRGLVVPLPRPVGTLRTTFCDADLRISRGGRGGVFVLRRIG